jgi:hypothetical protein
MIYFIKETIIFIRQPSAHTYKEYGFKYVMGGEGVKGLAVCYWAERSYICTHLRPNLNRVKNSINLILKQF